MLVHVAEPQLISSWCSLDHDFPTQAKKSTRGRTSKIPAPQIGKKENRENSTPQAVSALSTKQRLL